MPDKQPKRVTLTLKHPHEHGGTLHPAGARLDVWDFQAERIRAAEAARADAAGPDTDHDHGDT